MSRPLELTVYPKVLGAKFTPWGPARRFTDAELAAEYWECWYDSEVCSGWATDANIIKRSKERREIMSRFATLPHYDEPQP